MRIPSGVTDQVIYFVAVDATDLKTRETGLSSFTVYRDRNGAGAAAMTTPTVTEVDGTNLPGVYKLLLDEDMTIGAGNDTEEMVFHITQASMAPVTRTIELYRPKITAGYTLGVESDGDLTKVNTLDGHTAQTGDSFARIGATGSGLTSLAQAAVVGALADAAAAGDPTSADTLMQYVKQLVNVLVGTDGVATFPAEAAPGNAVSLAEVLRAIHADVTGLNGSAMRGTDSAALASVCTEARLAELGATNLPADIDTLIARLTAARAGYLDNLSAGAAALEASLTAIKGAGWSDENLTTIDALIDAIKAVTDVLPDAGALTTIGTDTARLTAARAGALTDWIDGGRLDLLLDAVKAVTDALTAAAAAKLALSAGTIVTGTVSHDNTAATTTVFYADNITEATADHYNGRIVLFTSGALLGQATDITDYELSAGEGKFTVTALTEAPADNVTFIIV